LQVADKTGAKGKKETVMIHELKIWPEYYKAVRDGRKTFEIRKNDRNFKVGDHLTLKEYDPETANYTGEELTVSVSYIMDNQPFVPEGFVVMSIEF